MIMAHLWSSVDGRLSREEVRRLGRTRTYRGRRMIYCIEKKRHLIIYPTKALWAVIRMDIRPWISTHINTTIPLMIFHRHNKIPFHHLRSGQSLPFLPSHFPRLTLPHLSVQYHSLIPNHPIANVTLFSLDMQMIQVRDWHYGRPRWKSHKIYRLYSSSPSIL